MTTNSTHVMIATREAQQGLELVARCVATGNIVSDSLKSTISRDWQIISPFVRRTISRDVLSHVQSSKRELVRLWLLKNGYAG